MTEVTVLGSTGSIGTQTLDVLRAYKGRFNVRALTCGSSIERICQQACEFQPDLIACRDREGIDELKRLLPARYNPDLVWGREGLSAAASLPGVEMVVNALVGSVGLEPTLAALRAGKDIALANKESLVVGGGLVTACSQRFGGQILPVDSEHNAIWQCLRGEDQETVSTLILTASGGPFRERSRKELEGITVEDALQHPNWDMGPKITIDSATLMNKGLEVIEAHWLFHIDYDRIEVILHPQSIIHSLVHFIDGTIKAELGRPDMKLPIQYALMYPERAPSCTRQEPDLARLPGLTFEKADQERFPLLAMAYDCGRKGGSYPVVLNAANEVAVEAFLSGKLGFPGIPGVVRKVLEAHRGHDLRNLEDVMSVDRWAREEAGTMCG